jgi:hypothetical protein
MSDKKLLNDMIAILQEHVGETGKSEGAVNVLKRLEKDHINHGKCRIKPEELE